MRWSFTIRIGVQNMSRQIVMGLVSELSLGDPVGGTKLTVLTSKS